MEEGLRGLMKVEVIPAILVETRRELLDRIHRVKPFVDTIQIDVMDGYFVPNTTLGVLELKGLPEGVDYEFHWMVEYPEKYIREIRGNHLHIVHVEVLSSLDLVQKAVRESGGTLGIALNPATPLEAIMPYMKKVRRVLVMTVQPGFSGQSYMPEMEEKIRALRKKFKALEIEVDGGINNKTALRAAEAGAEKIAASSSIFNAFSIGKAIEELKKSADRGCNKWARKSSG